MPITIKRLNDRREKPISHEVTLFSYCADAKGEAQICQVQPYTGTVVAFFIEICDWRAGQEES